MNGKLTYFEEIIDAGEKTHIIISVTNPGAPFVLVPAGMGLILAYVLINQGEYLEALGEGLLVGIGIPLILLQAGYYSKNRLRDLLVRALELRRVAS